MTKTEERKPKNNKNRRISKPKKESKPKNIYYVNKAVFILWVWNSFIPNYSTVFATPIPKPKNSFCSRNWWHENRGPVKSKRCPKIDLHSFKVTRFGLEGRLECRSISSGGYSLSFRENKTSTVQN
jgi:hypothetical protein